MIYVYDFYRKIFHLLTLNMRHYTYGALTYRDVSECLHHELVKFCTIRRPILTLKLHICRKKCVCYFAMFEETETCERI